MLGLVRFGGTQWRVDSRRKVGQYPGIDAIGLSQLPRGFGKVPHLTRIDDDHRQVGG